MEIEIVIIGAGPAGLSAAIAAAQVGGKVTVVDENRKAGGQLIKQIHKFFGRKENFAGMRGIDIGEHFLREARSLGVRIWLDSVIWGFFQDSTLGVVRKDRVKSIHFKRLLIATGASEKVIAFPGWTLPGVMGAGAIQTLVNVNRVLPGGKILMVGSGNVGLIVGYQLLQAGAEVVMVEALPKIGGYRVHADKIRRAGVPIYLSHSIKEAIGKESVEAAVIHRLDANLKPLRGTERILDVDTICLAVGLNPQVELANQAGLKMVYSSPLGGFLPLHSSFMETSHPDIFVAGDSAGIGEASSAMEEGRIAGLTMAESLGYPSTQINKPRNDALERLRDLRRGPFGRPIQLAKMEVFNKWNQVVQKVREEDSRKKITL
jgi:NADPH-dependent 2,4-dienoyl-CoA reductase/sulfur reductase-like enzyme